MSSPEVEKFEVTDYDYENEFNIDRPRRRQTKNDAIYGTFAGDNSESDGEWDSRPSFGGKKPSAAGINFVSGGIKKSAKDEANEAEAEKSADDPNVDPLLQEQFGRPRQRPTKQRRGFKSADRTGSQSIGEWERNTNAIGSKLLMQMGWKPGEGVGKGGKGIATPVEAKMRLGKGALGFYGSERTERSLKDFPVQDQEAEEDKKFKEQLSQWKRTEPGKKKVNYVYKTADELIAKGGKRKVKDTGKSKHSQVKVIDMTGREQKVLTGYHAISSKKRDSSDEEDARYSEAVPAEKKAFDMPELLHNLDMLIDMTEEEIITKDRQLRYERDMTVNMQHESNRLETLCAQETLQINRLSKILDIISVFEERAGGFNEMPLTLDECADMFTTLQEEYSDEYRAYDLVTLCIPVVFPLVKKYFAGWQPLSQPSFGCDMMRKWKALLDMDRRHGDSTANHNAYSKLVWDVWMPCLRTAVSQWNVRNADALIEVLEAWMPLLPQWMFQNILDQLVNPRLQMEVDGWNPLTDTVPIHAWLHPWLPLMGARLEPLYAPIRNKLANALTNWHPSDQSAKLMLTPWLTVFSAGHTEAFLAKNIVPKLAVCLQELVINPLNQNMENWKAVMAWQDILPDQVLVGMLDRCFFPRWLQVLTNWLNASPNYEEVGAWYQLWKSTIPERLHAHPTVKDRLSLALGLMNRSVTNPAVPITCPTMAAMAPVPLAPVIPGQPASIVSSIYGAGRPDYSGMTGPPPPPPIHPGESRRKQPGEPIAPPLSTSVPHSFKDLVAMKAAEENLEFYPLPGRSHEARPVYQCGKVQISIDRGVIFVLSGRQWTPVSLNQLLRQAAA